MPIELLPLTPTIFPVYQTVQAVRDRAAELPARQRVSIDAATDAEVGQASVQATKEIDRAMPYQGRRYDLTAEQVLEFPRVPYESSVVGSGQWAVGSEGAGVAEQIWDWDEDEDEAVVPEDVLLAHVHQVESVLLGDRDERQDARHDGVANQSADGLSESFAGARHVLCRRAHELMERYRLRSGQMI